MVFAVVKRHYDDNGSGMNVSMISKESDISSKRRLQQLIDELEQGSYIKTRVIQQKGNPRIIVPVESGGVD